MMRPTFLVATCCALLAAQAEARGGGNNCPAPTCLWNAWPKTAECAYSEALRRCTNTTFVTADGKARDADEQHAWGACAYGQFALGRDDCPCGRGLSIECACVSRARAEKGLDAKKSTLMLIGLILVPVAGLWAAATLWCLRTSHKCGVGCRADQARKEADCVRCCGCPASTVHQQTVFWNWFTPVGILGGGVALIVISAGIDVTKDYWWGCP